MISVRSATGAELGNHRISYDETDAILYALAVGAPSDRLDLVYERDLRVLPTYAAALGMWAVASAAEQLGYDESRVLHVGQELTVTEPLPPAADVEMHAHIAEVYDKTSAGLVELVVRSPFFSATYRMLVPGLGGWGGRRGRAPEFTSIEKSVASTEFAVPVNAAALYRLTGDRHPLHIDPHVAQAGAFPAPILHGLCTLGIVAREVSTGYGRHPSALRHLKASFRAPVHPGDTLTIDAGWAPEQSRAATAYVGDRVALLVADLAFDESPQ